MRLLGVTELQGFYFSRAIPADDVAAMLTGTVEASPEAAVAAIAKRG